MSHQCSFHKNHCTRNIGPSEPLAVWDNKHLEKIPMMKSLTIGACALALTTSLAFAQSSQPQGGAANSPTSTTNEMSKDKMGKDGMMKNNTTGMSNDSMKKDEMKDTKTPSEGKK